MSTKCSACGAPEKLNENSTCIYCGSILKNEVQNDELLKYFIPFQYEYAQENY
jgi:hypothetical protein